MAVVLAELFTGHPAAHIKLTSINGRDKRATTIKRGLQPTDFDKHLHAMKRRGAVGTSPTFSKEDAAGRKTWWCAWIALDFDSFGPRALLRLVEHLANVDVIAYLSEGTSGRGSHLHVFLEDAVPQREAYLLACAIRDIAKGCGFNTQELWPSAASGPSKALFLPYINAAGNLTGFNPLLEPHSLAPIPVMNLAHLKRTTLDALRALPRLTLSVQPKQPVGRPPHSAQKPIPADGANAFQTELERVRCFWINGKRDLLTMALAGYGCHLGVTHEEILDGIKNLVLNAGDNWLERQRVVKHTFVRWERYKSGDKNSLVAFHHYYQKAGVEAPSGSAKHPEVRHHARAIQHAVTTQRWPGKGGPSARDVLLVLARLAEQHGRLHREGIEVSASRRQLSEAADMSPSTAHSALERLERAGMIRRRHASKGELSGSLVLTWAATSGAYPNTLTTPLTTEAAASPGLLPSPPASYGREDASPLPPSVPSSTLLSRGGLPRGRGEILAKIRAADRSLTRQEVASLTGRKPSSLTRPLSDLLGLGLLAREGRTYTAVADIEARLNKLEKDSGLAIRAARRRERHVADRVARCAALQAAQIARTKQPEQTDPLEVASENAGARSHQQVHGFLLASAAHPHRHTAILEAVRITSCTRRGPKEHQPAMRLPLPKPLPSQPASRLIPRLFLREGRIGARSFQPSRPAPLWIWGLDP